MYRPRAVMSPMPDVTRRPRVLRALALGVALVGCGAVFPRYSTATRAVPDAFRSGGTLSPPPDGVRDLSVVMAELPPSRPDGRAWDDDGLADPYVVVYRDGTEVLRTPVARDTNRAMWEHARTTLDLRSAGSFRFELFDDDGAFDDAVGSVEVPGVPPEASQSGAWRVTFANHSVVQVALRAPEPRMGMGVTYEVHSDYLGVVEVMVPSPANTAGVAVGDRITHVEGQRVSDLGELGARQAMDRSAVRPITVIVTRPGGVTRALDVRVDAVYPAR